MQFVGLAVAIDEYNLIVCALYGAAFLSNGYIYTLSVGRIIYYREVAVAIYAKAKREDYSES